MALRKLGWASLRVCNLWKLDFRRFIVYRSIHDRGTSDIRAADMSRPDMRRRGCDCFRDMLDMSSRGTGSCPVSSSIVFSV